LATGSVARAAEAESIRQQAGVRTGLCVHLGTSGGELEAHLASGGTLLVHGLTNDATRLHAARRTIRERGVYGLASVEQAASLKNLPYADGMVNLLIVDLDTLGPDAPDEAERMRVVAPLGVAMIKKSGQWQRVAQPVSSQTDDWPQWDRGADGNPSSCDELVGPTNTLRWLAGTTTVDGAGSKVGLRITDGKVFYVNVNYSPDKYWGRRNPPRDVVARDAFNGVLLWRRSIDGVPGGGDQPPRFALTADDGRVYCFPQEGEPLQAVDAATGKTIVRFEDAPPLPKVTGWNKWQDPIRDIHFVVRVFDGKVLQTYQHEAYLSDTRSGKLLWKWSGREGNPIGWAVVGGGNIYLAVADGDLVHHRASHITPLGRIVALSAASGKPVWESNAVSGRGIFRMIYYRNSVIVPSCGESGKGYRQYGGPHIVTRLNAADGQVVWSTDDDPRKAGGHYSIVLARGDEVIVGQQSGFGVDFATGKVTRSYNWGQPDNSCADLKCVPGYTFYGLTFLDREGRTVTRGQTRAICDVGHFPAYGLLYNSPLGCLCAEYLNGYMALSPEPCNAPVADGERLAAGEVKVAADGSAGAWPANNEWPIHMATPSRGCFSSTPVGDEPQALWQQQVATRPEGVLPGDWRMNERIVGLVTAPTVAAGKVFVAAPDRHRLVAFDARTGRTAWSFTSGARIDSPPTVYPSGDEALCLFGCRDGWVYCLRAADGKRVWKFMAARCEKRIGVQSQLESPWPVVGSVMIDDGGVVVMAGRQSAIDGGISIYKLNPSDGRVIWKTRLWTDPDACRLVEDHRMLTRITRNRRTVDLLVHNGRQVCNWITPLKPEYGEGELVDIQTHVINARALRWAVPSGNELCEIDDATWLWAANSNGLLSRRVEGVGRHDNVGMCYSHLKAVKLVLAGDRLYAFRSSSGRSKDLVGPLVCVKIGRDRKPASKPVWKAKAPGHGSNDAMIVAGNRLYLSHHNPGEQTTSLHVFDVADGCPVAEIPLPARPVKDGIAAAYSRLYVSCEDGSVACLGE
jgi:outer membrane protein assembly factor BamB